MTRKEKLEYTIDFMRQWHKLDQRQRVPMLQWIALKWSCTPAEAQRMIEAARRVEAKRALST